MAAPLRSSRYSRGQAPNRCQSHSSDHCKVSEHYRRSHWRLSSSCTVNQRAIVVSVSSSMMLGVAVLFASGAAGADATVPLAVEYKISLGHVEGRIDHLAVDVDRQRLYIAELGNDAVGVVDLRERKTIRTLTGLKEPQGIGYVSSTDTVYVANSSDGSVRLFQGPDLTASARIDLGADADNVRVKDAAQQVVVGY